MSAAPSPPGSRALVWIHAARPRTLVAAIAPVLVGTALAFAEGRGRFGPAAAALLGAIWIQIGTNLANDYFDARKGADAERVGPVRVTQAGWVTPRAMKRAIALAFGVALLCGIYLVTAAGWPVVAIGLLSIAAGLAYTGGPYPLGYHGFGDLFVLVFFGIVAVAGTYYVQALRVTPLAVGLGFPVGFLSVAILAVNNLRDLETDRRAGKRTLVARFGRRFGEGQVLFLLIGAFALPVVFVAMERLGVGALLCLLAVPIAWRLMQRIRTRPDPVGWIAALGATARLLLVFGLLLSIGILL
jgi:1,4-dihydroxy-2-naphthoate octaprenyltransferase